MKLKEIVLTSSDYSDIKDRAHKIWIDKAVKDSYNHNTMCIVQAFVDMTVSKKLVIKDGKVYKNEEEKSS